MNAKVEEQNPEMVTIEVDGVELQAPKGSMLIEATDKAGIDVPRFCYHSKLSIAANCRMCLVDVERAPKPLPACATPVADGMKVHTASPRARAAQKGVMEFLLINHPLDCPICDQGGECELQDLALGYGRSVSRFSERKRIVKDENLGPLIATDMTRCIHCTRCVRFLDEIAGTKELGGMGRGEHMEIGTFVQRGVHSELSGNVIDLCPVGALTNKPFRYTARAWELLSHPAVSPHDCVGSNMSLHHRGGRIMRVVPRDHEGINETWLADRDRYSHFALYGEGRLTVPMVKREGRWEEVDWEVALDAAADGLRDVVARHGAEQIATAVSPTATLEEMYLLNRLTRELGSQNIDHRLRQGDFSDQDRAPLFPYLGQPIEDLENSDATLVIGSYLRWDQPLLNHRLRKAARRGNAVMFVNPRSFDFNFEPTENLVAASQALVPELAAIASALAEKAGQTPAGLDALLAGASVEDAHRRIAEQLAGAGRATVLVGNLVEGHPQGGALRALAAL
ncbi:NADH-quinone oxidoreductase subunit NuoG, partial [Ectothiorhodospiraceae bacterium WFHF3C12]|nr:NADH-quinone oxidoreductase subunit NuoG [Ectothiorhodospiraceae bacterium WFHF3C12]